MREQRDFMKVWAGQAVSNLGDGIHRVAVLWWARQATGSNTIVVLVALATMLPGVVAAPFAGWLADRFPRRMLMMASDAIMFATTALLALAATTGVLSTPLVISLAIVAALAASVEDPALQASISQLVPEERRATANSMLGANRAVAGIVGPALGGVLIGFAGTSAVFWVDAGTFAVSFVLVALSRIPMPVAKEADSNDGGLAAGFRVLQTDREVRDLVVVAAGLNFCLAPVPVLIVGFAAGPLGLGGTGFGALMAAVPAGLLVGLAIAPRFAHVASAMWWSILLVGAAVAFSGAAPWALWAGLAFIAAGFGVGIANTLVQTRFQSRVAPEVQGRVFALVGACMLVGQPLGLLLAAPLVATIGVRGGFAVCGLAVLAVAVAGRRGLGAKSPAGQIDGFREPSGDTLAVPLLAEKS